MRHHVRMERTARQRWFLKEWRKKRGYSQERLAEIIGSSKGYISELESGKRRYNQELLESLADALSCEPGDLIVRDPSDPAGLWSIYDALSPSQRVQLVEIGQTLKKAG